MEDCYDIIISLASNDQQREHLIEARKRLSEILSSVSFSPEMWTEPLSSRLVEKNFPSTEKKLYLNQLMYGTTSFSADRLQKELKTIEREMGRTPDCKQRGVVPIDLDLLQYGDCRYHLSDWERTYVRDLLIYVPSRPSMN